MNTPRLARWIGVIAVAIAIARAADDNVLRTLTGEVPSGIRALQADNSLGNVTVTGVESGFGWEWRLRESGRSTGRAASYADACQLDVTEKDGVLRLALVRPDHGRREQGGDRALRQFLSWLSFGAVSSDSITVHSDLILRVPMTVATDVKNRFGAVRVAGTKGNVGIDCRNGPVELANLEGVVTARTSFSHLRAQKIGPATLTNQNGSIEATRVMGDLRAATSFAKIKVLEVQGHAFLKDQNGAIEAVRISGDVTAETSFANLRVEEIGGKAELKGQNARIDVAGVTGAVKAQTSFAALAASGLGGSATLKNQNGSIRAERVTGDLNADTSFADLQVEAIGGNAVLGCPNGKIEAGRVTGDLRAKNSFASLRVREIDGKAELEGQNSEIAASGVAGDIRAQTSFGRLQLDGSGRRFHARSQNGAVQITARGADVEQIDVRLPKDAKPFIRAVTSFGKVQSEFPVMVADTVSDARFAAETSPLKVSLKGQNADIRIQALAAR